MDKGFLDAITKAKGTKVIDEGSVIIFTDYLASCNTKIRKNNDFIQRLIGQNDQLKLTAAMVSEVIRKYTKLQESIDEMKSDKDSGKEEEVKEKIVLPVEKGSEDTNNINARKTKVSKKKVGKSKFVEDVSK